MTEFEEKANILTNDENKKTVSAIGITCSKSMADFQFYKYFWESAP
jgi:hypothetical protein